MRVSLGTKKNYEYVLNQFRRFLGGKIDHTDLKQVKYAEFQKFLADQGLKDSYIVQIMVQLKTMIKLHNKTRATDFSIPELIVSKPKTNHKYLTLEQIKTIESLELDRNLSYYRMCFMVQVKTGMAYDDLMKVKSENIEQIGDGFMLRFYRGKTKVETRIPVSEEVKAMIEKLEFVSYHTYRRALIELGALAGFPITSHMARHTFGTMLAKKGIYREHIAAMMGHGSTQTTARYSYIPDDTLLNIKI